MADLTEFDFIAALGAAFGTSPECLSLKDDGAVLCEQSGQWVVVKDMMQAGTHVFADATLEQLLIKTLRTNLSDLAAMGAMPKFYLMGLALSRGINDQHMAHLIDAIAAEHEQFGIKLIGGDTIAGRSANLVSITALGSIATGKAPIRRSGAMPGDDLWVTGTLGDAALYLHLVQSGAIDTITEKDRAFLHDRYFRPEPRIDCGLTLNGLAHAAIDVSDGLMADAGHLATESGVQLQIRLQSIPRSSALQNLMQDNDARSVWNYLNGGDDYELLIAAPRGHRQVIMDLHTELGLNLHRIGEVVVGEGVVILDADGLPISLTGSGFTHF